MPTLEETLSLFEPEHHEVLREFSLDWWESKLRTKKKSTYAYPLEVVKRHGVEGLRDEPKVVVGTIHSVKGGEADVVYVFPDISRRAAEEIRNSSGRAAAIRQFYVAFTRAREQLCICRPDAQWYLHLPDP
jgi:superfamily I DNA/RNA helicase